MRHPRLQIIIGSTRPGRRGPAVADWFLVRAREHAGFDCELVDLAEVALPLLDEPRPPQHGRYAHDHTRRWSEIVSVADACVFVVPEYTASTRPLRTPSTTSPGNGPGNLSPSWGTAGSQLAPGPYKGCCRSSLRLGCCRSPDPCTFLMYDDRSRPQEGSRRPQDLSRAPSAYWTASCRSPKRPRPPGHPSPYEGVPVHRARRGGARWRARRQPEGGRLCRLRRRVVSGGEREKGRPRHGELSGAAGQRCRGPWGRLPTPSRPP